MGQSILNEGVGGNFQGIRITSGLFYLWQSSGITSELQLYAASVEATLRENQNNTATLKHVALKTRVEVVYLLGLYQNLIKNL